MNFPQIPNKFSYTEAIFNAEIFLQHLNVDFDPPEYLILCFQNSVFSYLVSKFKGQKTKEKIFFGDFYLLKSLNSKFGIVGNFGIGSPITAMIVDFFSVMGVSKFISLGTAGSLQHHIVAGDIILCSGAIRDEGTSLHYIQPTKFIYTDPQFLNTISTLFEENQLLVRQGLSWTIDAPFRETKQEVITYQKEGLLTVDMEASSLISVAQVKNRQALPIFIISDSLADLTWSHHKAINLRNKFFQLVKALLTL